MDSATESGIQIYLQWSEVNNTKVATLTARANDSDDFYITCSGQPISQDTWMHCAFVRKNQLVQLFQDGVGQIATWGISDGLMQVDRIALGGLSRSEWDDQVKDWACVANMDELRILSTKAIYDINAPTIDVPTGPFSK